MLSISISQTPNVSREREKSSSALSKCKHYYVIDRWDREGIEFTVSIRVGRA